jgi:hypothetical protein
VITGTTRAIEQEIEMNRPETEEDNGCTQIFRPPEIRQSRVETRRKRDASAEKGNAQVRKERKDSKKP